MAVGSFLRVTQRPLFGHQYVKAGDYEAIIGSLYESCAILGRKLSDEMDSLAQLLRFNLENKKEWIAFLKKRVDERLAQYNASYGTNPDSFMFFIMATDYARVGIFLPDGNKGSLDDFKRIERESQGKINISDANTWTRIETTLYEAIGFGLVYPELTWELVSKQHSLFDTNDEQWRKFLHLTGTQAPRELSTDSPQQAEDLVLNMVRGYVQRYRPELTAQLRFMKR
jgi:uncharacterized phage-associated protein